MICAESTPTAWCVTAPDGFESLFKSHSRAEKYAVDCHGVIDTLHKPAKYEPESTREPEKARP